MLVKLAWLVLLWGGWGVAGSELLRRLEGAHGENRVRLCLGLGGGECAGALWRRQWVLANATCLRHRHLYEVRVLRAADGLRCDNLHRGIEQYSARKLRMWFGHPASEGADVVLAALDRRYSDADPPANSSRYSLLSQYEPWMDEVHRRYPLAAMVSYRHEWSPFSSPLGMFLTTVLLPCVSFMVLFVFVVFYTGVPAAREVAYRSLAPEKGEADPLTLPDPLGA